MAMRHCTLGVDAVEKVGGERSEAHVLDLLKVGFPSVPRRCARNGPLLGNLDGFAVSRLRDTRRSLLVPRWPPDVVCERLEILHDGCKVELIAGGAFLQSFRDLTTDLAARMSRSVKIDIKVAVQEVLIQSLGRRLGQDRGALDRTVVHKVLARFV
jgi:hypothetical protein